MGFDYFVFYTEASAICVTILLIILITDRVYSTKQEKQIWFGRAITAFILYFISDACWAAMLSGQFPKVRFFVVLFNFTNYIFLSLMAYGMFIFIAASENMPFRKITWKRHLCFLPVIISIVFIMIAYIMDPLFWINENNELNDLYFPLLILVPSCFCIAGFILSVKYAGKAETRENKLRYLLVGSIPLCVGAFGMIQVIAINAPTFCFGCTIMWLCFYIQNMQTLISVDDLTHLNNRGQINRFLEQIHYSGDSRVFILMLDINRFKGINDTYGHAEGDRALIIVSEALRQACEQIKAPVFLGRYGGDEFTIIIQNPQKNEMPDQIASLIRNILSEKRKENRLPYDLEFSMGYDELRDDKDTVYDCIKRADEELYLDKQRSYSGFRSVGQRYPA